jgi:FKBP-type peptidyl-prolyl cis-trans isomerase
MAPASSAVSASEHPPAALAAAAPARPELGEAPPDAERRASGLMSQVLRVGTGRTHPGAQDQVEISCVGRTVDGQAFMDYRYHPLVFPIYRAIRGVAEGLQLMVEGERRRLWVPARLAYGTPSGSALPAGPLTFDIELRGFTVAPAPPAGLPPPAARRTASGLRYVVSKPGHGRHPPLAQEGVIVSLLAWTAKGRLFTDTSDWPRHVRIATLSRGLKEALLSMVAGERRTLWVPAALAHGALTPAEIVLPADDLTFESVDLGYRVASRWSCPFFLPGDMQACEADRWRHTPLGPIIVDVTLEALDSDFGGDPRRAAMSVTRRPRADARQPCICPPADPLCACPDATLAPWQQPW